MEEAEKRKQGRGVWREEEIGRSDKEEQKIKEDDLIGGERRCKQERGIGKWREEGRI